MLGLVLVTATLGCGRQTSVPEPIAEDVPVVLTDVTDNEATDMPTGHVATGDDWQDQSTGADNQDMGLDDETPTLPDFVLVSNVAPEVMQEIRYYSDYNFVGTRVDGYEQPVAIMTRQAGEALHWASDLAMARGYRLKIYDAYRPQQAVDHFVRWAQDMDDTAMKDLFYPDLDKSQLFPQGYIAERSGHTRGSTVDLTLVDASTGLDIDMGGTFDFFGERSHPDYQGVTNEQYANRMELQDIMTTAGFLPITTEWWHFGLADEPYPDTYFDAPVSERSVRH